MLTNESESLIVRAWQHAAEQATGHVHACAADASIQVSTQAVAHIHACAADAANEMMRPSAVYRPAIYIDGNDWCALYGENIQDGVAGFGDSPAEAMAAFDTAWAKKLGD